jgi:hypothetical protein
MCKRSIKVISRSYERGVGTASTFARLARA